MTRNHIRTTPDPTDPVVWQWGLRTAVDWALAAALVPFTWFYLTRSYTPAAWRVWNLLALTALHAILTVALERSLAHAPVRRRWRYRLAFLVAAGLPLLHALGSWLVFQFTRPFPALQASGLPLVAVLAAGVCGAFLGGLIATGLNESLWENNSPPAERIQVEVYQRHRASIGQPAAGPWAKRLFDLLLSGLGLLLAAPVWLLAAFLVWFEDPGPVLFVKNSVGKGGGNFHQFKFRTMVRGAESDTGPVLSQDGDSRVLRVGRFLRKTALDELPQLLNILRGEMSFVGPRPQRTVLVHGYLERMPEYATRHQVLPGLAGLAQVAGDYYLTPRQKLRFDRLYIRYIGLGFDLKLLLLACLITFWFRWQKGWNGRLPRWLLH